MTIDDKGFFETPVDIHLKAILIASAKDNASTVVEVESDSVRKKNIAIEIEKGCSLKGNILLQTTNKLIKKSRITIIWTSAKHKNIPLYLSIVKDRKYTAFLHPGKYTPNVIFNPIIKTGEMNIHKKAFAVKLPVVEIPSEKSSIDLDPLTIDDEILKSKIDPKKLHN